MLSSFATASPKNRPTKPPGRRRSLRWVRLSRRSPAAVWPRSPVCLHWRSCSTGLEQIWALSWSRQSWSVFSPSSAWCLDCWWRSQAWSIVQLTASSCLMSRSWATLPIGLARLCPSCLLLCWSEHTSAPAARTMSMTAWNRFAKMRSSWPKRKSARPSALRIPLLWSSRPETTTVKRKSFQRSRICATRCLSPDFLTSMRSAITNFLMKLRPASLPNCWTSISRLRSLLTEVMRWSTTNTEKL